MTNVSSAYNCNLTEPGSMRASLNIARADVVAAELEVARVQQRLRGLRLMERGLKSLIKIAEDDERCDGVDA